MQDGNDVREAELFGTEWIWYGVSRKEKKGGGVGFIAKKSLKPRIPKPCTNSSLLWLEIEHDGKWFVAVVYLPPGGEGVAKTIGELVQDILVLSNKGKVLVMGDFNAHVGQLPNTLDDVHGLWHAPICLERREGLR